MEMMTKKDYIKIVETFNYWTEMGNAPTTPDEQRRFNELVIAFADMFANENPRFDREVFYAAFNEFSFYKV
jgi:hypothetical protein